MNEDRQFLGQLKKGPAVLFLGQAYLRQDRDGDPFLSEILRKYGPCQTISSYSQMFETRASESAQSAAWMHEHSRRIPAPEWLKNVAAFPWSAVFTSAIDAIWVETFRNSWRTTQPVFDEKYRPADPRNRATLHTTFLFGCITQEDEDQRPPLTRSQWRKRRQVAVSLARSIPQVVSPLGCLVIESYLGASDWFAPEDLSPILDDFNIGQVHIFSAASNIVEDPDLRDLVAKGKVVLHEEHLAALLSRAARDGLLPTEIPGFDTEHRQTLINHEPKQVPTAVWNQVSRSAVILSSAIGHIPATRPTEDEIYRQFRSFLSSADGIPNWDGFTRGFAFRRHFEKTLREAVDKRLGTRQSEDEPFILHGQTGTGKTMALSALAYDIQKEATHPVLYIEKKLSRPNNSDIDVFCRWAEVEGALATLVIWDGMAEPEQYLNLMKFLTGRGRKVLLVGSSYKLSERFPRRQGVIEAPAALSIDEMKEFAAFLSRFQPDVARLIATRLRGDDTFLSAVYRLLPPARRQIRTGVAEEVDYAEQLLNELAKTLPGDGDTVLGATLRMALKKAGFPEQVRLISSEPRTVGDELVSELQELTGLVMVSGQFGLSVPFELLMRILGKRASSHFLALLSKVDIFRWAENNQGNIEIGPRNSLEARLLVESRMGGAHTEVSFVEHLLLEIRDSSSAFGGDAEINFAVDLLRKVGSSGSKRDYYLPYFKGLADTLRRLREERAVENPRLMLQEANLLREWAISQSRSGKSPVEVSRELGEAETILRRGLERTDNKSPSKTHLLVELASTLAARARALRQRPRDAIRFFEEARSALRQARVINPTNYYPIDVMSWATWDMLEVLDQKEKIEALADVFHMFQTANPSDFDPEQQERFHTRRLEYGDLLSRTDLADEAFAALAAQGSTAGYYIRAFRKSGLPTSAEPLTRESVSKLESAFQYLLSNQTNIQKDARCLDLMLELWWLVHTRKKFLDRERAALPLTIPQLKDCLDIILKLEETGESQRPVVVLFLRALVVFHLGDVEQSIELFKLVESESFPIRGRRRIIRSYVASNIDGTPKKFHGTVAWVSQEQATGERRGEVYVEELRRRLQFFPREFRRPEIARGESLPEFHIAFNFIGPIADPVEYYREPDPKS